MTPRDWLLLLVAFRGAPDGIEPVKLQKGLFLLAMEGDLPAKQKYDFVPYSFGPMSREIYRDVDALARAGLVERRAVQGRDWELVKITARGRAEAHRLYDEARETAPGDVLRLRRIKGQIAPQSFSALLHDVYRRYPAYATRSIFRP